MSSQEATEPPDFCFDQNGRDSGISSFSSDCSDSVYPTSFVLDSSKVGTVSEINNLLVSSGKDITFQLNYLGEYRLSRRHTPPMILWIVEEICARNEHEPVVMDVTKRSALVEYSSLKIKTNLNQSGEYFFKCKRKQVELKHPIKNLTRFSKAFRNPRRFSYLFRQSSDLVFTCYVYEAHDEEVVNNIFYVIHNSMLTAPRTLSEPSSPSSSTSFHMYDVHYVGKVMVSTKKAPPTFVDDAVRKFDQLAKHDSEVDAKGGDLETILESQTSPGGTNEDCSIGARQAKSCRKTSVERSCETLLQIGHDGVCLLSSDHKHPLKEWKFKDISFCSQGIICCNHFGFIAKNYSSTNYICYIFRCPTESLVDEIMLTMKKAFQSAFERSSRSLVVCEMCPMHQLHKLCIQLENMDQTAISKMLSEKMKHLAEQCHVEPAFAVRTTQDVPTLFESNVELMSRLLRMCEHHQQRHEHIGTTGKRNNNRETSDFVIFPSDPRNKRNEEANMLPVMEDVNGNETNLVRLHLDKWANEVKQRRHSVPHSLPIGSRSPEGSATDKKSPKNTTIFVSDSSTSDVVFMDKLIPEDSPIRSMFLKVGNVGGAKAKTKQMGRSSSVSSSTSLSPSSLSSILDSQLLPKHRGAWQINILSSLHLNNGSMDDDFFKERTDKEYIFHPKSTWKKAIGDTILLIRINKKNQELQTESDVEGVGSRVSYQEVTPCLKDVTKVWKQILESELWKSMKLDHELLAKSVRDGVPKEMRGRVWRLLVHQNRMHANNNNNSNNNKLLSTGSVSDEPFNCDAVDYEILKRQLTSHQHAILIDLGRTFPGHPYFVASSGPGQAALFNVLKAYSVLDVEVGYCQGLSFVAGVLLIHVSERDAFEILKHIMFRLGFRRQYKPNMVPLQIRMYQLTRMLHDSYRDLYEHLESHQISATLYAAPWFLTIFASQFPLGFVARVLDLIFAYGTDVILKVALILLGNHKELIKQCCTLETIVDFLKTTLPDMAIIQMERIFNQVFHLDISTTLEAYEMEYHILHEEMGGCASRTSPGVESQEKDKLVLRLSRVQLANDSLRRQKMELLEQLQSARRQIRSLESENNMLLSSEVNLKSQNRVLELERTALLNTMEKLMQQVSNNNNNNAGSETCCDVNGSGGGSDDDDDDDDDEQVVRGSEESRNVI